LDSPKQFQAFFGDKTLLQQTALRTNQTVRAMYAPPIVSCKTVHSETARQQLKSIDVAPQTMILEPVGRSSAPAIAIAALHAIAYAPDSLLLAAPADHSIPDAAAMADAIETAMPLAKTGDIVALGIRPRGPETGYGYIQAGDPQGAGGRRALRFVEKPDKPTAESYISQRDYYWNAGMFLFSPAAMIDEFRAHAPTLLENAERSYRESSPSQHMVSLSARTFSACDSISIDYAIMEKSARVAVVPVSFEWNDLGTWASMWETAQKDEDGNAIQGPVTAVDCRNCLIFSDGLPLSVMGLEAMIVVVANGSSLMTPISLSERVGELARNGSG
jgi:mannose-1-phosphate guanylyltransferase/mannose-6-phosphate isomerase